MNRSSFIFTAALVLLSVSCISCAAPAGNSAKENTAQEDTVQQAAPVTDTSDYYSEKVTFYRDGMKISGDLLIPQTDWQLPLVILSHGFAENRSAVSGYAQNFAKNGIAACIFDFIGGGKDIKSDGDTTQMSVLTEAADLEAVLDELRRDPRFDPDRVFLFGDSQGGFVSTYVAGDRPSEVAGLIALYPAYVIGDDARKRTPDIDNIPDTMDIMGLTLGSIYNRDAMSFDIYDQMKKYDGRVLIVHGTKDSLVPVSYSERAAETFANAELVKIEGADHGFFGEAADTAAQRSLAFVREALR